MRDICMLFIKSSGQHFQIYFNIDLMKYYIVDLGNGFGTFIKLQSETILKNNSLISLGESYIVCTLGIDDETGNFDNNGSLRLSGNPGNDYSEMLNIKIFCSGNKYDPLY
jgi:hypothetical protein